MSTPVEDIDVRNMREVHFTQLLSYIIWAEDGGIYYGNKHHYDIRHEDLKRWVNSIIDKYDSE